MIDLIRDTHTAYVVACGAVLIAMIMIIVRAAKGPTVYDRILAVNAFGTLTVLLIGLYGFLKGRPEFLDIALVYALINFIGTITVTKYIKFVGLGHPGHLDDDPGDV